MISAWVGILPQLFSKCTNKENVMFLEQVRQKSALKQLPILHRSTPENITEAAED